MIKMKLVLSGLLLSASAQTANAVTTSYKLDTTFSGASFFSQFNFFTGPDPTHGFVTYLDQTTATRQGLTSVVRGIPRWGVDTTTVLPATGPGRNSVRISSKKSWTHGLFIADIAHMPGTICGLWPAFWTLGVGATWPANGEIDIIEGVNSQKTNLMSAHTSPNCMITGANQLGTLQTNDCDTAANDNSGCGTLSNNANSYGTPFNKVNGGVYAMEWTSTYIRVWFWPRSSVPADIQSGAPIPSGWGLPQANFQGNCNIDGHFKNHQIVFDTTFCGDWAGNVFSSDATCKTKAASCAAYVAGNPTAFAEAYWAINSIKVYQLATVNTPLDTPLSSAKNGVASTVTKTVQEVSHEPVGRPKSTSPPAKVNDSKASATTSPSNGGVNGVPGNIPGQIVSALTDITAILPTSPFSTPPNPLMGLIPFLNPGLNLDSAPKVSPSAPAVTQITPDPGNTNVQGVNNKLGVAQSSTITSDASASEGQPDGVNLPPPKTIQHTASPLPQITPTQANAILQGQNALGISTSPIPTVHHFLSPSQSITDLADSNIQDALDNGPSIPQITPSPNMTTANIQGAYIQNGIVSYPDYLPPATAAQMPVYQILGLPRGGCGCEDDENSAATVTVGTAYATADCDEEDVTSTTTSTTTQTIYVHLERPTDIIEYGIMTPAAGSGLISNATTRNGQASSMPTGYIQVSSNGAVLPVDVRLGAVGVGVVMLFLVGLVL